MTKLGAMDLPTALTLLAAWVGLLGRLAHPASGSGWFLES
jgi:hypothetical protein